jgi:hypothetical protein
MYVGDGDRGPDGVSDADLFLLTLTSLAESAGPVPPIRRVPLRLHVRPVF